MKFFKYGVEIFDGKYTEYGGHWQYLSKLTGLDYLIFNFQKPFMFSTMHEWYDGMHHCISIGWFRISWGGKPYPDNI